MLLMPKTTVIPPNKQGLGIRDLTLTEKRYVQL